MEESRSGRREAIEGVINGPLTVIWVDVIYYLSIIFRAANYSISEFI